jgi:DNA replication protein DnaC
VGRGHPITHPDFGRLLMCPDCLGPRVAAQKKARAEEAAQHRIDKLLSSSGLLPAHRSLNLGHIHDRGPGARAMLAAARAVLAGRLHFITVYGPPGNGKSTLARALTMEFVRQGQAAAYARASKLFRFIQGGIGDSSYTLADRYEEVLAVNFLALDEPEDDKLNFTPFVRQHLLELIDHRYELARCGEAVTLIALNKEPRTFLPPYICDRLEYGLADSAHSNFRLIHNTDPSARRAGL